MTTITREQAQKIIDAADEVITALAGTNDDVHPESDNMLRLWDDLNDRYAPPEIVRELARIALAATDAEPIYQVWDDGKWCDYEERIWRELYDEHSANMFRIVYAAPPAPVASDDSEDKKRLDWLDAQNKRLNEYYGTNYGWKFDANFQRNAMMLNDSNYPVMTVRQAIDEAIHQHNRMRDK